LVVVGVVGIGLLGVDIIEDGGVVVARDGVMGVIGTGVKGILASTGVRSMKAVIGVGTGDGIGESTIEGETGEIGVTGVRGVRGAWAVIGVEIPGEEGTPSSTRISATLFETPFLPFPRGAQTGEASPLPCSSPSLSCWGVEAIISCGLSGISKSTWRWSSTIFSMAWTSDPSSLFDLCIAAAGISPFFFLPPNRNGLKNDFFPLPVPIPAELGVSSSGTSTPSFPAVWSGADGIPSLPGGISTLNRLPEFEYDVEVVRFANFNGLTLRMDDSSNTIQPSFKWVLNTGTRGVGNKVSARGAIAWHICLGFIKEGLNPNDPARWVVDIAFHQYINHPKGRGTYGGIESWVYDWIVI
jgi:hypothetical protein